jgi:hypothetical protein
VPEGVSEAARGGDVVRRILQNLGAIGNGIAELRGLYGTGHGREGTARVNLLFETHKEAMP